MRVVQAGDGRSYCTVAKDVSASAIQTISRQHSGSSLQRASELEETLQRRGDQGASSVSSAPAALTVFQRETPGHRPAG